MCTVLWHLYLFAVQLVADHLTLNGVAELVWNRSSSTYSVQLFKCNQKQFLSPPWTKTPWCVYPPLSSSAIMGFLWRWSLAPYQLMNWWGESTESSRYDFKHGRIKCCLPFLSHFILVLDDQWTGCVCVFELPLMLIHVHQHTWTHPSPVTGEEEVTAPVIKKQPWP